MLDIGCGYGAVAYSVASRTGAMVDRHRPSGGKYCQSTAALPASESGRSFRGDVLQDLPKKYFDVIMLSNILEHIEHRVEFLATVHERLSPATLLDPGADVRSGMAGAIRKELAMSYFSDPTHYTEYTQESFEKEIRAAGLAITHVQINWGEIWAEARPGAPEGSNGHLPLWRRLPFSCRYITRTAISAPPSKAYSGKHSREFEFLIVNDASTDGCGKIMRSFSDNRIQGLENETNLGLARTA